MKKVFVDCTPELHELFESENLSVPDDIEIHNGTYNDAELLAWCDGAETIMVEHTNIPDSVLADSQTLRHIVFMGTGAASYINLPLASRRGIKVSTVAGYGNRAVAEHAIALMFAAARKIAQMDLEIRAGNWVPMSGIQLQGKRLAVVGLGGVGLEVAGIGKALGMDVRGWSYTPLDAEFYRANLEEALEDAEFVSVHLALNPETSGLIDLRLLQLAKPGFIFVNTARDALVKTDDFRLALESGLIGHAALDVFDVEPLPAEHWLLGKSNVTLTAHAAYMTKEAYRSLWQKTVEKLAAG
ncbi:NAD(P)-dependent oxidoreductase [Burkholderia orbicola]|uniref:NAD(P)-dependent oxidoreductase n=1 Tax=Burkholderia orbicola TaxID=2978683 RepID=UPI0026567A56|nr:NAD(P)-dependent oxidoreductase [Burkholderia orbicola]MDN7559102.1 NAD(P)-dependent oxidoreductase [Burkholderia orbicola]